MLDRVKLCALSLNDLILDISRTARSVIEIIRRSGVVPATVAILNGELHIGKSGFVYFEMPR